MIDVIPHMPHKLSTSITVYEHFRIEPVEKCVDWLSRVSTSSKKVLTKWPAKMMLL